MTVSERLYGRKIPELDKYFEQAKKRELGEDNVKESISATLHDIKSRLDALKK